VWDAVSIALPTVEATQTSDIIGNRVRFFTPDEATFVNGIEHPVVMSFRGPSPGQAVWWCVWCRRASGNVKSLSFLHFGTSANRTQNVLFSDGYMFFPERGSCVS
jgi:hypothetical protein